MSQSNLVDEARQLLEILGELEQGKAYDLDQLGEHIGAKTKKELAEVAQMLKDQGCVEIIRGKDDSGLPIVALALRSLDFDPGLVTGPSANEPSEKKGGIVDTNVFLSANKAERPKAADSRVNVRFDPRPSLPKEPEPKKEPKFGELTIEQILLQLAQAVEQSDAIDPSTKYPLLEKIKTVATHPAIDFWLKTPLKNMLAD